MVQLIEDFCVTLKERIGKDLTFSQIELGIYEIELSNFELNILIYEDNVVDRIKPSSLNKKNIHIDIDVLQSSTKIILDRLLVLTGQGRRVFARNTVAARIDKKNTIIFLEENHLQGAMPGKYRYGLFEKGELISIAVFSGGRRMRNKSEEYRSFELIRFCHKGTTIVVGGLSKLLLAFTKEFNPSDIMTYVDRDWAQTSALSTIGFEEQGVTVPQSFVIENGKRILLSKNHHSDKELPLKRNLGSIKMILNIEKKN